MLFKLRLQRVESKINNGLGKNTWRYMWNEINANLYIVINIRSETIFFSWIKFNYPLYYYAIKSNIPLLYIILNVKSNPKKLFYNLLSKSYDS